MFELSHLSTRYWLYTKAFFASDINMESQLLE